MGLAAARASTFAAIEDAVDEALAAIDRDGIDAAELDRAKTRLVADAVYAQDSQATLARYFGTTLSTGGSVDDLLTWPRRIAAVTADEVREAARRHLLGSRSVDRPARERVMRLLVARGLRRQPVTVLP